MVTTPLLFALLLTVGHASADAVVCKDGIDTEVRVVNGSIIESEGYAEGSPYPNDYTCRVTLFTSSPLKKIRLDFDDFDVEASAQCRADRLIVHDVVGGDLRKIGAYCTSERPKAIVTSSNVVQIQFTSDRIRPGRGFKIRATLTSGQSVCSRSQFQCEDRSCVPINRQCDGVFDCADASDERRCLVKPFLNKATCGRPVIQPSESRTDRIVGGDEAVPHSWPWQVSIQKKRAEPVDHFCGGTIIGAEWIIGAGHCFAEGITSANEVVVKAGVYDMLNPSPGQQTRHPSIIIMHPLFGRGADLNYDIALIKVSPPFNFTDTVRPICIPAHGSEVALNTTCFTAGWGDTRGSGHAFRLKQIKMRVQEFGNCRNHIVLGAGVHGRNSICAGSVDGISGPCHGDSGGPLVCKDPNGTWYIHGTTSLITQAAITSGVCGMGTPAIWSSVTRHSEWVRDEISSN